MRGEPPFTLIVEASEEVALDPELMDRFIENALIRFWREAPISDAPIIMGFDRTVLLDGSVRLIFEQRKESDNG